MPWIRDAIREAGFVVAAAAFAPALSSAADLCNCGDIPECCPEAGTIELTFARRFTGDYRHGEPYDILTVSPDGRGETLEEMGIRLRVRIVCSCGGLPLAGIPAQEIVLFNTSACWCPGGNVAAHDTDADGWTEFTGTLRAGGCTTSLTLFVDGVAVATVPIKTNSPDLVTASACFVDASDMSAFAIRLGIPALYHICFDYNEDGHVDASDLSFFASLRGAACE